MLNNQENDELDSGDNVVDPPSWLIRLRVAKQVETPNAIVNSSFGGVGLGGGAGMKMALPTVKIPLRGRNVNAFVIEAIRNFFT